MKYLSLLPLLFFGAALSAQQLNTSSFYEIQAQLHNPAAAGSRQQAFVGSSFKKQWNGMPGSPQTGIVYAQTFLPAARLGLGGSIYHDVTGPTSRTGLQMAYAYHIPVGEESSFSLGIEGRLQQLRFDRLKLQAALGSVDPVAAGLANRSKADAGFGIAYTSPTWQAGVAVSQLVQSKYKLYEMAGTLAEQSKLYRHYYLHGSYNWRTDEATVITPNALFIYLPNAPFAVQTGARVTHNNLFWYGLSWRRQQGWLLSAGVKLKEKLSVGYSFDMYNSPLSVYEKGAAGHELMLHYQLR